jgi:hypothetical protein
MVLMESPGVLTCRRISALSEHTITRRGTPVAIKVADTSRVTTRLGRMVMSLVSSGRMGRFALSRWQEVVDPF